MSLAHLFFDHCHQLFLQRERESGGVRHLIRIGEKFTVCFRFAENQSVEKFLRPFAHLSVSEQEFISEHLSTSELPFEPDLTICVWNSHEAPTAVPPRPTWDEELRKPEIVSSGNIRIFSEVDPDTLSLLDTDRKTGLFWIDDFNQVPWMHMAHPLYVILAWWALSRGMQFLHAGCVGTPDNGALIIGGPGTGKSTLCLSAISENLSYAADDFCLVGTEGGAPIVYSLYSTAMLSPLVQIPQLDSYKLDHPDVSPRKANSALPANVDTESKSTDQMSTNTEMSGADKKQGLDKAIVSVLECRPDKMITKVPITSIVLLSPTESSGESLIEPISAKEAISALSSSISLVMEMMGFSAAEFLGLHRMFSGIPCFKLYRRADLSAATREIAKLVNQAQHEATFNDEATFEDGAKPDPGVEQCTQA
jgi:hypothetical protein